MLLETQPDLRVAAQTGDGAEAVKVALAAEVDLAILDIAMPRMTGLQPARELSRRRPNIRILMLSMHENEQYLYEALDSGTSGYVIKTGALFMLGVVGAFVVAGDTQRQRRQRDMTASLAG